MVQKKKPLIVPPGVCPMSTPGSQKVGQHPTKANWSQQIHEKMPLDSQKVLFLRMSFHHEKQLMPPPPPKFKEFCPLKNWFLAKTRVLASWYAGNKLSTRVLQQKVFEYTNLLNGSVWKKIKQNQGVDVWSSLLPAYHLIGPMANQVTDAGRKSTEGHRSIDDFEHWKLQPSVCLFEWNDETTVFQRRWGGEISGDNKNKWENGNRLQHVQSCKKRSK